LKVGLGKTLVSIFYLYKSKTEFKMDIQALKLDLVEKIVQTEKTSILFKIKELLQNEKTSDWWENLPIEVQESIFEGLEDIKEGKVFTHDQIISEAKQKYGF